MCGVAAHTREGINSSVSCGPKDNKSIDLYVSLSWGLARRCELSALLQCEKDMTRDVAKVSLQVTLRT
jgi:hypothetical protein